MELKSEGVDKKSKFDFDVFRQRALKTFNMLSTLGVFAYVALMSFEKLPADHTYVIYAGMIKLMIVNMYYSLAPKDELQEFEDKPFTTLLSKHLLIGPIYIFSYIGMFFLVVSGNAVGWFWLVSMLVGMIAIGQLHKERKGVSCILS